MPFKNLALYQVNYNYKVLLQPLQSLNRYETINSEIQIQNKKETLNGNSFHGSKNSLLESTSNK